MFNGRSGLLIPRVHDLARNTIAGGVVIPIAAAVAIAVAVAVAIDVAVDVDVTAAVTAAVFSVAIPPTAVLLLLLHREADGGRHTVEVGSTSLP
jgi:uncharacterized RDD family membrane protein YckC